MSLIRADGGGDSPEDIMGGLKVALFSLNWRSKASKVHSYSYFLTQL